MSVHALSGQQFGEQLPMFMSAHEIKSAYKPLGADHQEKYDDNGDYTGHTETSDELWERKSEEAVDAGLTDDLMEHGVNTPIPLNVDSHELANGHHRVAAMSDISPSELLPVQHFQQHELKHGVYRGGGNAHSWDY